MADFIKLCEKIIDSNGNPTVKDVLECGYSLDHFIRMSQPNIKADKLLKNAKQALMDRGIHYKEENKMKTRFYVCGICYDENDCVTDYEWSFGDFDKYEDAYELFVTLKHKNAKSFFTGSKANVYQMLLQLEECEEDDDTITCIDVKNAWYIENPNKL